MDEEKKTRRQLSRREFLKQALVVGAGAGAVALIPGCAPAAAPAATAAATSAAAQTTAGAGGFNWKQFSGRTIRVLLWEHPEVNEWKKRIPDFQTLTGINVNWEQVSLADVYTKTILELSQAPDKLDVYSLVPPQHARMFTREGWMQNLKPMLADTNLTSPDYDYADFLPGVAGSLTYDNGNLIGGVPMYINTEVLTYRKDLYQAKGLKPPETFDDLMNNAAALHDPTNQLYGIVMRGIGPQAVWHWSAWMWGYGANWLDQNGKASVNTPEAVQAMKEYGDTLGKYGPTGPTDLDDGRMIALFMAGQAGHHYSSPVYSPDFNDPAKSKAAGKLGWALVPAGPKGRFTESVGVGLAISSKSPNKEPAWYLLQYLTSKAMMTYMQSNVGIQTGRQSAWNDAGFVDKYSKLGMDEWRLTVVKALQGGRGDPLPPVTDMAAARDAIGAAITVAIKLGSLSDIQKAADTANASYQKLLDAS
jgi:multiple sugar transport system substrate-binding protein